MRLSKEDILKAADREAVEVDCPEWGGTVLVRGMSGRERDAFEVSLEQDAGGAVQVQRGRGGGRVPGRNLVNIRAKVVVRCVVDDDGQRLFSDSDAAALGEKSGAAVDRVFAVASRLSGMSDQDMEEYAANFGKADGAGSSSDSPPASARRPKSSSP